MSYAIGSAAFVRESIDRAGREGLRVFVLDGSGVADLEGFVDALRASVPLDPPLASARSLDAIADSIFGGLVELPGPVFLAWTDAWKLAEEQPETFTVLVEILGDVDSWLSAPRPEGSGHEPTIAVAVRP